MPNDLDPHRADIEYSFPKPPHYLQASSKKLPILEGIAYSNQLPSESHVGVEESGFHMPNVMDFEIM